MTEERFPTMYEIQLRAVAESLQRHRNHKPSVAAELKLSLRTVYAWQQRIRKHRKKGETTA